MSQETIEICGQSYNQESDHFSFYEDFSDLQELAKLSGFPNLKSATLTSSNLNDFGLKFICQCSQVDNLCLQDTRISKIGIAYLVRLKKLTHLRLKENHQLGNDCVPYLNRLQSLIDLQIHETGIDQDGIQNLNLPSLRNLLVNEVDQEVLEALSKKLPQCSILVKGKIQYLDGKVIWKRPF